MSTPTVVVIGGGLAGSEAAWQAAEGGLQVVLLEMRPARQTGAHQTGHLAELVCSNSLGSALPDRASGILMAELERLGSLLLREARAAALPAGGALAVDRLRFSEGVTRAIESHPRIAVIREEARAVPEGMVIIASGPLTSPALSSELARLAGEEHLYFFDALSPIVEAETIDLACRLPRFALRAGPGAGGRLPELSPGCLGVRGLRGRSGRSGADRAARV